MKNPVLVWSIFKVTGWVRSSPMSHQGQRIDVHGNALTGFEHLGPTSALDDRPQGVGVRGKQEHLPSCAPPDSSDRAGFGGLQFNPFQQQRSQCLRELLCRGSTSRFVLIPDHDACHSPHRWQVEAVSLDEFPGGEGLEVVMSSDPDRRGIRLEGLDDRDPGRGASSAAAGDLGDQLVGAFGGSEVRQVQGRVGIHHPDQANVGEIPAPWQSSGCRAAP